MSVFMRCLIALPLAALAVVSPAAAEEPWFSRTMDHLSDVWKTGAGELYVPLHTHHLRAAYDEAKIEQYQEKPYGLGYGRSKLDAKGNLRGLYAMTFQDSHFKPSYMVGYVYQALWNPAPDWRIGAGLTAFVMTRADTNHYMPFPGVLPVGSIGYKWLAIEASYVPGSRNNGNVVFFWGRFALK